MPRITPSSGSQVLDVSQLEDHEPYTGVLTKIDVTIGGVQYGSKPQLTLDWELENGESLRDWIGLSLRIQPNGAPAKLRQLLNALSEKPAQTEIAWFDSDTREWSYEKSGAPSNKLVEGMTVVFRGVKTGGDADGQGKKYSVNVYQMAKKAAATNGAAKTKLKPAASDDTIPF